MEPTILYEDKDVIAIHKPSGLVVHSDGKTVEPTVVDWFLRLHPKAKDVGEPGRSQKGEELARSGIVHRLDRETSGVMLLAKTTTGFEHLKKQFQNHEIKKEYHAFIYGNLKTDHGVIDRPIGKSNKDFRMWSAQRGAKGELRDAVTKYDVVLRGKVDEDYSFVHAYPQTGRTHQIRVHFKAIHHPLVADSLYAPDHANSLGFTRLALHSYQITFAKIDGVKETVTAPYPKDFSKALKILQK